MDALSYQALACLSSRKAGRLGASVVDPVLENDPVSL